MVVQFKWFMFRQTNKDSNKPAVLYQSSISFQLYLIQHEGIDFQLLSVESNWLGASPWDKLSQKNQPSLPRELPFIHCMDLNPPYLLVYLVACLQNPANKTTFHLKMHNNIMFTPYLWRTFIKTSHHNRTSLLNQPVHHIKYQLNLHFSKDISCTETHHNATSLIYHHHQAHSIKRCPSKC